MICKVKIQRSILVLTTILFVLAVSSCSVKDNGITQTNEIPISTSPSPDIEVIASASPSPDTESSYIVSENQLDKSKPYVKHFNPYGDITYIQLGDKTAGELGTMLGTAKDEVDILQYIGTKNEFYSEEIYLYIGDKLDDEQSFFDNGYSVLHNSEGELCLRDTKSGITYAADDLCSKLISIVRGLGVTSDITTDKITSIVKAELWVNNDKLMEITDKETLVKLESLFRNSERTFYPSTYIIAAVLTLTNADGSKVEIELDDVGDICIIGHTYWYDYGPGTDGDNARNNLKELFSLLGITAWPENK